MENLEGLYVKYVDLIHTHPRNHWRYNLNIVKNKNLNRVGMEICSIQQNVHYAMHWIHIYGPVNTPFPTGVGGHRCLLPSHLHLVHSSFHRGLVVRVKRSLILNPSDLLSRAREDTFIHYRQGFRYARIAMNHRVFMVIMAFFFCSLHKGAMIHV